MSIRKLTEEIVRKEVAENHLTDIEIAQKYNASYIRVGNIRRQLDLKPNKANRSSLKNITKEKLQELYNEYGTDSKVANTLGVPFTSIKQLRKKYGLEALR